MKKKILIISIVTIGVLVVLGLITSFKDNARVRTGLDPKYTIKIVKGNKTTYIGLGYKVIKYNNSKSVKYGSWFMKYEPKKEYSIGKTEIKNVEIGIYDVTRTGATIIIKDTNEKPYIYGSWYKLEKEENGTWEDVEVIVKGGYGFDEMAYIVDENQEVTFTMDWSWLYGSLPEGSYRVVKDVDHNYISVEFNIAETSK